MYVGNILFILNPPPEITCFNRKSWLKMALSYHSSLVCLEEGMSRITCLWLLAQQFCCWFCSFSHPFIHHQNRLVFICQVQKSHEKHTVEEKNTKHLVVQGVRYRVPQIFITMFFALGFVWIGGLCSYMSTVRVLVISNNQELISQPGA